ncbi:MAG: asparagine synthase (glutamine-hydrolyzing) [Phycisphaerales bacterium]|nr:asparagine synthase (glutamine-hydrolyzing) [Phycisphaerales bacterium]
MCGIAGILSLSADSRVSLDELRPMAAALVHRGPDDDGFAVLAGGRCGLAFRRLSIIDVAGGRQPVSNEDDSVTAVFNGEIYNFRELREELIALGHRFRSQSDSETIVHAYEQWGEEFLPRLAGMFAIALWDDRASRLLLARDRLGKKPLVTAQFGDRLYFASEAKAILALPGIPRRLCPHALHDYLVLQYVPAPRSIFGGFEKLLPGAVRIIRADHPSDAALDLQPDSTAPGAQRRYWRVPPADHRFDGSYADALERLDLLLTRAVERRLISDVPLGAFLSGGIDSSIVVGLMHRLGVCPLRTFSIGFSDPRYDETAAARMVAARFGTQHTEQLVTPRAADLLDRLAWHYDEPFADSSALPTWHVAEITRRSVTVALSGDGGDEAFGGYDRYRALRWAARLDRAPLLRSAAAGLAALLPHGRAKSLGNRAYRFLSAMSASPHDRYAEWVSVFAESTLWADYCPQWADRLRADGTVEESVRRRLTAASGFPEIRTATAAMRTDYQTYLPGDLLTKVDIATMANSLECRAPLLDHELIEFALSLPEEWKLRGRHGKHILRDWARRLLPREILNRPKSGFGVPVGEWFRGELRETLEGELLADGSLSRRILRRDSLQRLLAEHRDGRANHAHRLWSLLMLERWQRCWQARID